MRRSSLKVWGPLVLAVAGVACGDDDVGATASDTDDPTGATESSPSTSISASASGSGTGTETATATESAPDTETEGDTESDTDTTTTDSSSSSSSGEPNEPPEPENDQYLAFTAEMPLSIDADNGVLANDADPDSDELTVSAFDDPSLLGVTVDVAADGSFTYTSDGAYWGGPDGFSYTVSDGEEEVTADVELLIVPDVIPLDRVGGGFGGFAIDGQTDDLAGRSVAVAGDVNNDGLADVVVGAPANDGIVYVVFGKDDGDTIDVADVAAGTGGGFAITPENAGDNLGISVAGAGFVNDDGFADLIVGAPESDATESGGGRAWVVFGKADTTAVDLADLGENGFVIEPEAVGDGMGNAVAGLGDLDGDGLHEIAVAADDANPSGGDSGRVYVVFGKDDADPVDGATIAAGTGGFVISGAVANNSAGRSVAGIGDFNGDLVPDILVGVPRFGVDPNDAGAAFVVFGKSDGGSVALDGVDTQALSIVGEVSGDDAGEAVGPAGDLNDDGFADLIVAAPDNAEGGAAAGRAYVVFGTDETDTIFLSDVAGGTGGFSIDPAAGTELGLSVAGGGDVNGDGVPDVIVGGQPTTAGRSFVVHGKADGTAVDPADLAMGTGGFVIDGEQLIDLAGFAVGAGGDINGDGLSDLVVGAFGYPGGVASGRTYVIFGSLSAFPE